MALSIDYKIEALIYPKFTNFDLYNLYLSSKVLKNNPLADPEFRNNPILAPQNPKTEKMGLIFVLPGFASNGTRFLADKGFEESHLQQLVQLISQKKAPQALYVYIDAWTLWGGSQFVNSMGTGNYEDYIVKELYPILIRNFNINTKKVAVIGQSSGGYGALHLSSKYPLLFPFSGAIAPDCFFEASLLPDFYKASPFLHENNSYLKLLKLQKQRQLIKQKNGFTILNAIGMTACYSPTLKTKKKSLDLDWPIDFATGKLNSSVWKRWLERDPIHFLPKRRLKLKKLKGLYLDVGCRDEFHLQMGLRQIHRWLLSNKISHHFSEYAGGHFDGHDRYPFLWEWLQKNWQT